MTASVAAKPTLVGTVLAWLRYDAGAVVEVESAYDTFIRRAKFGWWLLGSIVATAVTVVFVTILHRGEPKAHIAIVAVPPALCVFYGIQLLPLLFVPRAALATMLRGCIDVRRGVLAGMLLGVVAAIVEFACMAALYAMKTKLPKHADIFANGIAFGVLIALLAAPFVEEFQMQAWLQTRLRPAGGVWAGILTTVVFVLMHIPKTSYEIVRVATLGLAAVLRGTTRSLAACIAIHFTNNFIVTGIYLLAISLSHGHHAPNGSH